MNKDIFSSNELNWLKRHEELEEIIAESLEDSLNTNSLDNGEPDLRPYHRAIKAAHITIAASEKKLIAGPYDNTQWQMITKYLAEFAVPDNRENVFWSLFSFHCACFKEEDETFADERIYMEAMKEMIRAIDEGTFQLMEQTTHIANLNDNTIQEIKGVGIHAKFEG